MFVLYQIRRFMTLFFDSDVDHKKREWLIYGLFLFLMEGAFLWFRYPPLITLINICMIYVATLPYEGSRKKRILVTLFIYSACMVCETLAVYLCWHGDASEWTYMPEVSFITALFICICEFITQRFLIRHRELYDIPHCNVLILVPIISIGLLLYLAMSHMRDRNVLILISFCMLCINLLIFYLYNVLMETFSELEEKIMYERLAAGYENQSKVMIQSDEKMQSLRHDMKHHLGELLLMAESSGKQALIDYIRNMRTYLDNPDEYISSGNKGVDSLVNYMLREAKQTLKKVDYKISIPREIGISSFDLNVIIGNLLDNAIHAASSSREKWLSVALNFEKGMLFIRIQNSYDHIIRKQGTHYASTRESGHGIGLQNVRKAVDNYHGSMQISDTDHIFDVKILLYTLQK